MHHIRHLFPYSSVNKSLITKPYPPRCVYAFKKETLQNHHPNSLICIPSHTQPHKHTRVKKCIAAKRCRLAGAWVRGGGIYARHNAGARVHMRSGWLAGGSPSSLAALRRERERTRTTPSASPILPPRRFFSARGVARLVRELVNF